MKFSRTFLIIIIAVVLIGAVALGWIFAAQRQTVNINNSTQTITPSPVKKTVPKVDEQTDLNNIDNDLKNLDSLDQDINDATKDLDNTNFDPSQLDKI